MLLSHEHWDQHVLLCLVTQSQSHKAIDNCSPKLGCRQTSTVGGTFGLICGFYAMKLRRCEEQSAEGVGVGGRVEQAFDEEVEGAGGVGG